MSLFFFNKQTYDKLKIYQNKEQRLIYYTDLGNNNYSLIHVDLPLMYVFHLKQYKIDTPVLIDVEHGSVRYRYGSYKGEPANKSRRVERPFQGEEKVGKQNYFYHARLNDFSESRNFSF